MFRAHTLTPSIAFFVKGDPHDDDDDDVTCSQLRFSKMRDGKKGTLLCLKKQREGCSGLWGVVSLMFTQSGYILSLICSSCDDDIAYVWLHIHTYLS